MLSRMCQETQLLNTGGFKSNTLAPYKHVDMHIQCIAPQNENYFELIYNINMLLVVLLHNTKYQNIVVGTGGKATFLNILKTTFEGLWDMLSVKYLSMHCNNICDVANRGKRKTEFKEIESKDGMHMSLEIH